MPVYAQNRVLNFDGTNDFIQINTNGIFTSYTIETWVKFNGTTNNQSVIVGTNASGSLAAYSHQIRTDAIGRFVHYTFDGGQKSVVGSTVAVTGIWYHVAMVADNGGVSRLFVNGVEEGTPVNIGTLWTGIDRFNVGSSTGGIAVAPAASFFNGEIDELRVWNYARCRADFMLTMNCELTGNELNLRSYYNFNQGVAGGTNAGQTTLTNNATSGITFNGTLTNFALTGATSNWINSTNGVNGTCAAPPTAATGNRALNFDGANDNISIANNGRFNFTGDFTVEVMVKPNRLGVFSGIILTEPTAGSAGQVGWGIRQRTSNRFALNIGREGVSNIFIEDGPTIQVGVWYHLAVSRTGNTYSFYVNGTLIASQSTNVVLNSTFPLSLGILNSGIERFLGELDEVKIWNYARCAADINATRNCELTGNEVGLVSYYNFNQGIAGGTNIGQTTLINNAASGNTFDGTLNNFSLLSQCTSNWVNSTSGVNGTCAAPPTVAIGNRALSLDGANDFVRINSNGIFTSYTIESWVKFNGTTANQNVIVGTNASGALAAYSHQIRTDATGRFVHYTFDGGPQSVVGTTIAVTNRWYHVAIVAENDGVSRLFVNGVEEGTPANIGTLWTGIDRFHIGSSSGQIIIAPTANFFSGEIDELRIWNYPRCRADIMRTMNCEFTGNEAGLRSYYNFNQGVASGINTSLTTLTNNAASGNTFDGTLNNFSLLSQCTSNWVSSTNGVSANCNFRPIPISDLTLSNNSIQENNAVNDVIGTLGILPNNPCIYIFNYTLVSGQLDNSLFNLDNNQLRTSASFDFEEKSSYQILVRVTGSFGSLDKIFTINIINVIDANEIILTPEISSVKAGSREVRLEWLSITSADQYEIFIYSTNNPMQRLVGITNENSFLVTGLENGITYYFRVIAILSKFSIRSGFSNTVSARPSIVLGTEDENRNNVFKLYPNPNNGNFQLFISELKGKNAQISVFDLMGRTVYTQNLQVSNGLETALQLDLASGVYFVQVSTERDNLKKKLVIEK